MICILLNRAEKSPYGGRRQKPSSIANSRPLAMCGVTALSCGRSCPMGRDPIGTCPIKM
uniref:Uncharacterized protein n=1 Tax=Anguilla anguilla TaxID=7936 RepID=A0A0E9TSR2_ANGAN